MRRRGRIRVILLAVAGLLAVAAGIGAYATDLFQSAELQSADARFSVRGDQKPPGDLVVVGIDEDTQVRLRQRFPFPRSSHAKVIDRLKADGAKVIALDITIAQPS